MQDDDTCPGCGIELSDNARKVLRALQDKNELKAQGLRFWALLSPHELTKALRPLLDNGIIEQEGDIFRMRRTPSHGEGLR
jgi:predicted transcriptional regulator